MMRRALMSTVALVAVGGFVTGCSPSSPTEETTSSGSGPAALTEVKIVEAPLLDFAPVWVGQEQGFFEAEGLTVVSDGGGATTSAEAVALVMSGEYQFVSSALFAAAMAAEQGMDIQMAVALSEYPAPEDNRQIGTVVAAGSAASASDLPEGATVAVNGIDGLTNVVFKAALAEDGVSRGFSYQAGPMPTLTELVATGSAAAAVVAEPWVTAAAGDAAVEVIDYPGRALPGGAVAIGLVTTSSFAADNGDTVTALRNALESSIAWIEDPANAEPLIELLASKTGLDPELIRSAQLPQYGAQIEKTASRGLLELFATHGALGSVPNIDDLLVP